jgi:hypothetical protein
MVSEGNNKVGRKGILRCEACRKIHSKVQLPSQRALTFLVQVCNRYDLLRILQEAWDFLRSEMGAQEGGMSKAGQATPNSRRRSYQ